MLGPPGVFEPLTWTPHQCRPCRTLPAAATVKGVRADVIEAYRLAEIASDRKYAAKYRRQAATGQSGSTAYTVADLVGWADKHEANAARLEAVGPVTTDKASWGVTDANLASTPESWGTIGWCGRLDLARKLADKERRTWREVVILDVATGATVLHVGRLDAQLVGAVAV